MIAAIGIRKVSVLLITLSLLIAGPAIAATDNEQRAAAALFDRYETIFYTNADLSSPLTPYFA
jgi:hypothetical protein